MFQSILGNIIIHLDNNKLKKIINKYRVKNLMNKTIQSAQIKLLAEEINVIKKANNKEVMSQGLTMIPMKKKERTKISNQKNNLIPQLRGLWYNQMFV